MNLVIALALGLTAAMAAGQESTTKNQTDSAAERSLFEAIEELVHPEPDPMLMLRAERRREQLDAGQRLLEVIDEFLQRFPKTRRRGEALSIRLDALSQLARIDPSFLDALLAETSRIARADPKGELASENAYFAIQAFVLGARRERMERSRILEGTFERYAAFVEDHPESKRLPIMWASLIRTALRLEKVKRAEQELARFAKRFPDDPAFRRAYGEVNRALIVGTEFGFEYQSADGSILRTSDHIGSVILLHFWSSSSKASIADLPRLVKLHEKLEHKGLVLAGVCIDQSRLPMRETMRKQKITWPQYFDGRGFENAMLVDTGVTGLPTYFLIDRRGILVSDDPGDKLEELVAKLLAQPAKTKDRAGGPDGPPTKPPAAKDPPASPKP